MYEAEVGIEAEAGRPGVPARFITDCVLNRRHTGVPWRLFPAIAMIQGHLLITLLGAVRLQVGCVDASDPIAPCDFYPGLSSARTAARVKERSVLSAAGRARAIGQFCCLNLIRRSLGCVAIDPPPGAWQPELSVCPVSFASRSPNIAPGFGTGIQTSLEWLKLPEWQQAVATRV